MGKLPVMSATELCSLLSLKGYEIDHQTGSHLILRNVNYPFRRLTVPNHKELAKGTLRAIVRESGLTLDEFMKLKYK